MSPIEIKILLIRRGLTITGLADRFDCYREQLSMCIRQVRVYPELRKKLAKELGLSVGDLFGSREDHKAA